jgi:hypothetical protein
VLIDTYPIPQLGHVLQYRPNRLLWSCASDGAQRSWHFRREWRADVP